jgi:hypothetical protein
MRDLPKDLVSEDRHRAAVRLERVVEGQLLVGQPKLVAPPGAPELPETFIDCTRRRVGVQASECRLEATDEEDLAVVVALGAGLLRRDLGSVPDLVAERAEPVEEEILDDRLCDRSPGGHALEELYVAGFSI